MNFVYPLETFYFLLVESNMRPNQTDLTEIFQPSSLKCIVPMKIPT